MARQGINTGSSPDAGDGDALLIGAIKINNNFNEIYTLLGDGTNLSPGIVTSIVAGTNVTVSGSTGQVTINASGSGGSSSQWVSTAAGIHTLSSVGIGTTNPTSALTVKGNTSLENLSVSGVSTFSGLVVGLQPMSGGNVNLDGNNLQLSANGIDFGSRGNIVFYQKNSFGNQTEIATLYSDTGNLSIDGILSGAGVTVTGTTFTNQLNVSGIATFAGSNVKINSGNSLDFGTGAGDLHIYRQSGGSNDSIIKYDGSYNFKVLSDITTLASSAGSVTWGVFGNNGVELYYSNSKKFETLGTGVTVTGTTFTNDLSVSGIATIGPVATGTTSLYLGGPLKVGEIDISGGSNSVHVGQGAGRKNYNGGSGQQNTAVGYNALGVNQASNFNTAFGISALGALGDTQFSNYDENTAIGAHAGGSLLTGNANTFVGRSSGLYITSGTRNTILGKYDGNQNGLDIRTSSNNVVLADGDGNIRFYANSSGNVGLGTTNPTEKLTVRGGDISVGVSTAHGVILTSPNGTQYRLIIDDSGTLNTVAV